jgi:hypothetical protein
MQAGTSSFTVVFNYPNNAGSESRHVVASDAADAQAVVQSDFGGTAVIIAVFGGNQENIKDAVS